MDFFKLLVRITVNISFKEDVIFFYTSWADKALKGALVKAVILVNCKTLQKYFVTCL